MKRILLFLVPVMMLASCKEGAVPAIDPTDLDTSVAPGENFFQYANGGWMQKNPLSAEYARYGSFDVLREDNVKRLNDLFQSMTSMKTEPLSVEEKIVTLYKQALDSTTRNALGAAPIKKWLDLIYSAKSKEEVIDVLAELNKTGDGGFFGCSVESDLADSKQQVLYFGQGGLGMGDRDYYLEESNAELKKGYQAMLEKLFVLAGIENASAAAANSLLVEDKLAKASWTSVQCRDMQAIYNPMSTGQMTDSFKGFDFNRFFASCGVEAQEKVIVAQPSFFKAFGNIFASTPVEVLNDYIAAQFLSGNSGNLSDDFYEANFDFFSRQMSGITEQRPRWKRAMAVPNNLLGEAVGQMYVEKYFPEEYKNKVLEIVHNLQSSLAEHIDSLDWMTDATKTYAKEKLSSFTIKIGYPDKWKDYSTLAVDPKLGYFENLEAASRWYVKDNLDKLGKPTDPTEWFMTPQTVNAYYNPTTNEICFPAAILQPPFFNADADDAVNYGAIGVVIGHEMTHGFDDQGRLFDKNGNMNDWWTPQDAAAFQSKADVLIAQFDKVEILPGQMANGKLTIGENIADQGGVGIAYTAFRNSLGGKEPEPIDGFSADQRFFLGYAHVWAQNITDEEKARLTKLDVHSLGSNRVNVTLRNFQIFFDAFGVKEGDAMWRPAEERVMIW